MSYTPEQIQMVCNAGYEIMKEFTTVQNCTFPSSAIIKAMNKGKSAEEVGLAAYNAIAKLPIRQGALAQVGMGDSMHNIATYLQNEVTKRVEACNASVIIP